MADGQRSRCRKVAPAIRCGFELYEDGSSSGVLPNGSLPEREFFGAGQHPGVKAPRRALPRVASPSPSTDARLAVSVVLDRVVPVGNNILVVRRPLHHAFSHQLIGPELERECLAGVQDGRRRAFARHETHEEH